MRQAKLNIHGDDILAYEAIYTLLKFQPSTESNIFKVIKVLVQDQVARISLLSFPAILLTGFARQFVPSSVLRAQVALTMLSGPRVSARLLLSWLSWLYRALSYRLLRTRSVGLLLMRGWLIVR